MNEARTTGLLLWLATLLLIVGYGLCSRLDLPELDVGSALALANLPALLRRLFVRHPSGVVISPSEFGRH